MPGVYVHDYAAKPHGAQTQRNPALPCLAQNDGKRKKVQHEHLKHFFFANDAVDDNS